MVVWCQLAFSFLISLDLFTATLLFQLKPAVQRASENRGKGWLFLFFLSFYFEIILDLLKSYKDSTESSWVLFSPLPNASI